MGKNNQNKMMNGHVHQRFSLRKYSFGVVSVMLGSFIFFGVPTATAHAADAAPLTTPAVVQGTQEAANYPMEVAANDGSDKKLVAVQNTIGMDNHDASGVSLNLTGNVKDGDVIDITIPYSNAAYSVNSDTMDKKAGNADLVSFEKIPNSVVTTERINNPDGSVTIRNVSEGSGTIRSLITIGIPKVNPQNNNPANGTHLTQTYGAMPREITWTINGVAQTPLKFEEIVDPYLQNSNIARPSDKELPAIEVKTDYMYKVDAGDMLGISEKINPSGKILIQNNYGTTITVPVPEGFLLNQPLTMKASEIKDQTTIEQPNGVGTPVIITVPMGSGSTGNGDANPYILMGQFTQDEPLEDVKLTAPAPISVVKQINADGTTITANGNVFTETLRGKNNKGPRGTYGIKAYPNNATSDFVLDNDDTNNPKIVNYFGFSNTSIDKLDHPVFTMELADGFNVNGFKLPAEQVPGNKTRAAILSVTDWDYELTYTDGTTSTGSAKAGEVVNGEAGKNIAKITVTTEGISPNEQTDQIKPESELVPGVYNNNYGPTKQNNSLNLFTIYGELAKTHRDGTPLDKNDVLTSKITLTSNGQTLEDHVDQRLISNDGLQSALDQWTYQNAKLKYAGDEKAGKIGTKRSTNKNKKTDAIKEPTLYFVLPAATTFNSLDTLGNLDKKNSVRPKVSEFTTSDGRIVVKLDYKGTGFVFDATQTTPIILDNLPDATKGFYPWDYYVVTETPLVDDVNPIVTSEYTEGQPAAKVKGGSWEIMSGDIASAIEMSQGNLNPTLMVAKRGGLSDDKGVQDMTYYANFVNNRDRELLNTRYYINLPQASDPATVNPTPSPADGLGSTEPEESFTFQLTGPVKVNTQDTDIEIFYSTKTFVGKDDSNVASDYVTADQVADWSQIKSVLIKKGAIAPYSALGRVTLAGIDPTLEEDAGKTGYLTSVLISDSMEPYTISRDDNQKSMSKIHVVGTSTITTRYHYVDENGADQYIEIPTLTHTYNDMKDTLPHDDFRLTDVEKKLIPAGYKLVPASEENPTVKKGDTDYNWNDQVKPAMDGTIVTYELVPYGSVKVNYKAIDDAGNVTDEELQPDADDTVDETVGTKYDTTDNDMKPATIVKDGVTYKLRTDKTAGNETGDVVRGLTEVTYYYQPVGSVTVHHVDEDGNPIEGHDPSNSQEVPSTQTDTDNEFTGTPYDTTDKGMKPTKIVTKDGKTYELVEDKTKGEENGTVEPGDKEVTYVYREVKGDVVVHYVDEEGNTLQADEVDTPETSTGTDYNTADDHKPTEITKDGHTYRLVPEKTEGNEDGKVVEGTTHVTYVYKLVTGNVTVHYEDEDGNEISDPVEDEKDKPAGDPYDTTDHKPKEIKTPDGKTYELVENKTKGEEGGTVEEGDKDVTYVYKEVKGNVIVHYINEAGETIAVDAEDTPETSTGTEYNTADDHKPTTITTPDGKTYVLVPTATIGNETGEVVPGTTEITYVYKEVKGNVIVHYVDEEGNTIQNDATDTENESTGKPYDTTDNGMKPTTITTEDGVTYELVPDKTKGNETGDIVEGTQEVTYVYKKVKGNVIVHYVNEAGEVIKDPVDDEKDTPSGEPFDTTDNKPTTITTEDGKTYQLVPEKTEGAEDGKVKPGTQEVTYVYKEVFGNVIVHYVDEDGNTIQKDATDTENESTGKPYDTTDNNMKPTTITTEDGVTYELVPEKTKGNETGDVVEGTQEVTYVYKKVKGNVIVHYVNEAGEVIKDPVDDEKDTPSGEPFDTTDNKPTTITTKDGKTYQLVPEKTNGAEDGKVKPWTQEVTYVYREVVTSIPNDYPTVDLPEAEIPEITEIPNDYPTVDKPSLELPSVDEPTVEVPADQPSVDEPTVEVPAKQPSVDEPTVEEVKKSAVVAKSTTKPAAAAQLPQTGNAENNSSIAALGLTSLAMMLGLAKRKKRN